MSRDWLFCHVLSSQISILFPSKVILFDQFISAVWAKLNATIQDIPVWVHCFGVVFKPSDSPLRLFIRKAWDSVYLSPNNLTDIPLNKDFLQRCVLYSLNLKWSNCPIFLTKILLLYCPALEHQYLFSYLAIGNRMPSHNANTVKFILQPRLSSSHRRPSWPWMC